jgi:hypothetical protein
MQRSAPDDSDPVGVVPAGPETVLDANMAALRASPWSRALVMSTAAEERAARAAAQGFDEVADVDRVVFAVTEGAAGPTTLMVAQGRFDERRLAGALGAPWKAGAWRGSRLWEQGDRAVALLTARTLISGAPAAVRAAIDCAWGIVPDARGAAGMAELRRALDGDRAAATVTAIVAVTEPMRRRIGGEVELPPGLQRVAVRLDLGQALELELLALLATPRDAAAAAHNLDVLLRDLRARPALNAFGLAAVFDGVSLRTEGARVRGRLNLPEDRREDLSAKIGFVVDTIVRARGK